MANALHQYTLIASGSSTRRIWRAYFDLSFRILTRAHLFLFKFQQRFQVIICSVSVQNSRASLVIHSNGWLSLDARNECCCLIQDTCHGDFYWCEEIIFWGNFSRFLLREDRLFVTRLRYLFVSDKISASEGGWFVFWALHKKAGALLTDCDNSLKSVCKLLTKSPIAYLDRDLFDYKRGRSLESDFDAQIHYLIGTSIVSAFLKKQWVLFICGHFIAW